MTTEAALTKLAYLLALPKATPESVSREMSISLRGEITGGTRIAFSHPTGALNTQTTTLTAIAYAISAGDLQRTKDLLRNGSQELLSRPDYSGNTPLHLAATGPSIEVLRYLLSLGSSVHMRNYTGSGRTPLFLAANAGHAGHVRLLRQAGAHLHAEEWETAQLHVRQRPEVWAQAGVMVARRLAESP